MKQSRKYDSHEEAEKIKEQERARIIQQIDPHFIFNTLGAIRIATKTNADLAYDMIYDFSKYLRCVLHTVTHRENILFKEEAAHVITYLNLEKIRFGDNIMFCMDIQTEDFMLPPLSLPPLVDNAVRHGLQRGRRKGMVTLRTYQTAAEYIVQVEDDGVGFETAQYSVLPADDSAQAGGLQRVKYLMENMADGSLEMKSLLGVGTVVTLHIPKTPEDKQSERVVHHEDKSYFGG
ncbi:MAG: sensor histidine kinase [Bacillus sp. (in: Bacteria)]|nr:sensor histidine kinase [Bacillus sp. (in: firmicutes)]MCM1426676.1 sensor histidine kinase [Eubacterium sp.]